MGFVIWAGICLVVGLIGGLVGYAVFNSDWYNKRENRRLDVLSTPKVEKKSKAFVAGYEDMTAWTGVDMSVHVAVPSPKFHSEYGYGAAYTHIIYSDGSPYVNRSMHTVVRKTVEVGENGMPRAKDSALREIALKVIDEGLVLDLYSALDSREYLSGEEDEFKDYYAGGARLLADVSDMESTILNERAEEVRKDMLVEARRRGLKEVSTRLSKDMKELTDARTKLFSPESLEANWERLVAEACTTDDTVVR